jgi:hypothetical protein
MTNHQADHSAKSLNDPTDRSTTSRRQDIRNSAPGGMLDSPVMSLNELLLPTLSPMLLSPPPFLGPHSFLMESMSMRDLIFDPSAASLLRGDACSQRQGLAEILNTALALISDNTEYGDDDITDDDDDLFFNSPPSAQRSSQSPSPPQ